jgi:hypothetical protein
MRLLKRIAIIAVGLILGASAVWILVVVWRLV